MRRLPWVVALVVISGVAGCASAVPENAPVVGTMLLDDNKVIAFSVSSYLSSQLPPGPTTFALAAALVRDQAVVDRLGVDLRGYGFGVASPKADVAGAVLLRLVVSAAEGGYVVQIAYGSRTAATYLGRTASGNLVASNAYLRRVS